MHYAAEDPWVEAEEVEALGEAVGDLPEYDRSSSEAMWERVLAFLDRVDARGSGGEPR